MNTNYEEGLQRLFDLAKDSKMTLKMRRQLLRGVDQIIKGQIGYLDRIKELEELLYRNPAFPDDLVGWLDDDFDDDDEDNEDE